MLETNYNREHSLKKRVSQLRAMEDTLEAKIERLYRDHVGHSPTLVQCAFLSTSDLYIYMEGTHSPSENFLEDYGSSDIARRMRLAINQIIKRKINETLESDLRVRTHEIRLLKPYRSEQLNVLVSFYL